MGKNITRLKYILYYKIYLDTSIAPIMRTYMRNVEIIAQQGIIQKYLKRNNDRVLFSTFSIYFPSLFPPFSSPQKIINEGNPIDRAIIPSNITN